MAKHDTAKDLMDNIIANNETKVEEFLNQGDSMLWRQLIRYEFDIESIKNPELRKLALLPKLLAYEIKTLSSLHVTALLGATDMLILLMEKDVPIDIISISGTTALHLACLSGHEKMVNVLIEVYKADVHRVDRYGWSALHYACTEGHLIIVKSLVEHGIEIDARDQDGTTPAFRAQVNGHDHIVKYLLLHGSDDDQLNIIDSSDNDQLKKVSDLYAKVNKTKVNTPNESQQNVNQSESNHGAVMMASDPTNLERSVSEDSPLSGFSTAPKPAKRRNRQSVGGMSKSKTLPSKSKTNGPPPCPKKRESIRRIIRKELEMSFGPDSEYEAPINSKETGKLNIWEEEELKDIGVKTLTGLMREEFDKYKQELSRVPSEPPPPPEQNTKDTEYEDLYEALAGLPVAPPPPLQAEDLPDAPPLPPRNLSMDRRKASLGSEEEAKKHLNLASFNSNNPALVVSFQRLAPLLGKNWKKLAHTLPLADSPTKVDERITAIEKQKSKSVSDQALRALTEWRFRKGNEANVDALIIALRKCNLHNVIPEVEKATQEFTA